jgi:hypothetical protein
MRRMRSRWLPSELEGSEVFTRQSSRAIKTPDPLTSAIRASHRFFRLGKWPERTWQAKTSQITRVEIRLVISAAS